MNEPSIALVFSPEPWVERLHRHLADHGGARVRQIVLDPTLALEEHYDVLVVSHRWPGLTHRLVAALRERGRSVLGVFDPDEPAGREHLEALGAARVVPADSDVAQFVEALESLPRSVGPERRTGPGARSDRSDAARPRGAIVVTGARGAGASEVALALAHASSQHRATALVDAQEHGAALAVRLGLPLTPGLRDAVDAVEHAAGALVATLTRVAPRLDVLPGLFGGALAPVAPPEVRGVVGALHESGRAVVVDADAGSGVGRAVLADAAVVVFVAGASPIGVAHTLAWASDRAGALPATHVVLNRAPRERFRRGELERELARTLGSVPVWFAPADGRVEVAAWDGTLARRGPFTSAIERLAGAAVPAGARPAPRALRRRRGRAVRSAA